MIHLSNVSKQYGSQILYHGANLQINPGEKIGLVGPNGAGKTTIFRLLTGEESPDQGQVSKPEDVTVGYFSQTVGEMATGSVLQTVTEGAGEVSVLAGQIKQMDAQLQDPDSLSEDQMSELLERYGEVQSQFEARDGYTLESRAKEILTGLGISPENHQRPVSSFSGGWKMRIALAQILAMKPQVLLMDEPTNHLDVESIVWLESFIANYKGAVVMTSHDRDFMNRLVTKIVEIANKSVTTYSGNYDFYEKERDIRHSQLLAAHKRQQDMLAKEEEFIARFAARASHAAQVQSRVKKLDKIDRIEIPPEERVMKFEFPKAPRSGNDVFKFEQLGKTYDREGQSPLKVFSGASGLVRRLDKVAVVGVNGAGKSTFLKILAGLTPPTEGTCVAGASLKMGYFSQYSMDVLKPQNTIYEEVVSRLPDATLGYVRNLLGAFQFSGEDVEKKVSVLSGGEKSRVVLATILANPTNLLILDEPTNHLDIRSREVLMNALQGYEGTLLMVSHDRYFLRAIANRVFELDRGELRVQERTYAEYAQSHH